MLCACLMASALLVLPGTAHANSNSDTYDLSGTFNNGATIQSGSSFTLTNGSLNGVTIDTSVGDFSCAGVTPSNVCTFYALGNGVDEFNVSNGTYYLSIQFLASNLTGFPSNLPLSTGSFLELSATDTYSALTSGSGTLVTPEPGTFVLLLSGIAGLFFLGLRRARA